MGKNESASEVVRFPQWRVSPPGSAKPAKILGVGKMAELLGEPAHQTTGHWCGRCRGIWFGYPLEVACPVCRNRHG